MNCGLADNGKRPVVAIDECQVLYNLVKLPIPIKELRSWIPFTGGRGSGPASAIPLGRG